MGAMWRADPVGWLSRGYRITNGGELVGNVESGAWNSRGTIELVRRRFTVRRDGFWNPWYELADGREVLARARSAGAFRRGFVLFHGGQQGDDKGGEEYRLEQATFFGRAFELTRRGEALGRIRPLGFLARSAEIELDEELAPELRLFAFWLVALAWRRASAAAAAS